jgi:predicted transcriptional regulator
MKRSKLEIRLDILKVLEHGRLMNPSQIMYRVNICYKSLEHHLNYLVKQNLVERKASSECRVKYVITLRGLAALRSYGEIKGILLMSEEHILDSVLPELSPRA